MFKLRDLACRMTAESPPEEGRGQWGRRALKSGVLLVLAASLFWTQSQQGYAQSGSIRSNQGAQIGGQPNRPAPLAPLSQPSAEPFPAALEDGLQGELDGLLSPEGLTGTLKVFILLTVLSLAPSILIMTTSFIRFVVVLGLLRQALGTQQLPPNQVVVSLCLFLTLAVMSPVWKQSYDQGIKPYTDPAPGQPIPRLEVVIQRTLAPIRRFMENQIEGTGNSDAVWLFVDYQQPLPGSPASQSYKRPETYDDISLSVLLPAFMVSELKTAFVIGFQLYLPFLIIDMVISSVLISMGMMMLPPVLISLPFKLLLFVMIDGWTLTIGMLLASVTGFS